MDQKFTHTYIVHTWPWVEVMSFSLTDEQVTLNLVKVLVEVVSYKYVIAIIVNLRLRLLHYVTIVNF